MVYGAETMGNLFVLYLTWPALLPPLPSLAQWSKINNSICKFWFKCSVNAEIYQISCRAHKVRIKTICSFLIDSYYWRKRSQKFYSGLTETLCFPNNIPLNRSLCDGAQGTPVKFKGESRFLRCLLILNWSPCAPRRRSAGQADRLTGRLVAADGCQMR